MKRILFLTLILQPVFLFAQLQVLLKEDFSDNHREWYETKSGNYSIRVTDGFYEMNSPTEGMMTYIYPDLDNNRDFSFEASFSQTVGDGSNGFGFIWGYDGEVSLNNFIISSDGYGKIWSSDTSRTDAKDWFRIEGIRPMGMANQLKVAHEKGILKFYVNEREVLSMKALPWFGNTIGFAVYTNMRLLIDNFIIAGEVDINLPIDMPTGLRKENLGAAVNTVYDEVTPKISVDGNTLYFTRKNSPENSGGVKDESDIWFSTTSDGITWTPAQNIGPPINSADINNIVSMSQDNNTMLVATHNDFGVYDRTAAGWKANGVLGVNYVNESDYFEASQAADRKAILLAVRNKQSLYYQDNLDERDIFVVLKQPSGKWSDPVNLGPVINTQGNEISPFLAPDGRTLYFASDGHKGYGGIDIFMSKRLDETWTNWSRPVNLGPEINTSGYDAYYTVPASGDVAYLCSVEGGFGKSDIMRVVLPVTVKPNPVVLVRGNVLNARTKVPIQAEIVFENLTTGNEAGEAYSNPSTGEYRIALPYGVNYGLRANAKGFISVNENLELVNGSVYIEYGKDLFLVPLEAGESLQLNNVFFEQGRPLLKVESYPELDRLAVIMKENPTMVIELGGHTDNIGNPRSLIVLSQERVKAVKDYLVENGIAANRITGKGYGGARPLVKNDSEENRRKNRRVEFTIIKK